MYIRIGKVCEKRGRGSSSLYEDIAHGLLPPPIKRGRASLWIEDEIDAVLAAEAAGATDDEIRELVQEFTAARQNRARDVRAAALRVAPQHHAA
tara:strand:- start:13662 stop:13943 length:282 start_codon:yes stop_codon:yes gene_type:complete